MKAQSPAVTLTGALVVAVLAAFGTLNYWQTVTAYNHQYPDPYRVGRADSRYGKAAAEIPEDAVVGYLSNLDFSTLDGSAGFFSAQYALTPRILVPIGSEHAGEFVLVNYSVGFNAAALADEHRLTVVKEFGAGLAVFRKKGEQ